MSTSCPVVPNRPHQVQYPPDSELCLGMHPFSEEAKSLLRFYSIIFVFVLCVNHGVWTLTIIVCGRRDYLKLNIYEDIS
jgi:hypothetical protein